MTGKKWKSEEYWIGMNSVSLTDTLEDRVTEWARKSLPDNGYDLKYITTVNIYDYDAYISFTKEKYQTLFLLAFGDEI